jgi:hypothetical protein
MSEEKLDLRIGQGLIDRGVPQTAMIKCLFRGVDFDPKVLPDYFMMDGYKARRSRVHGHNGLAPGAWFAVPRAMVIQGAHSDFRGSVFNYSRKDGVYSLWVAPRFALDVRNTSRTLWCSSLRAMYWTSPPREMMAALEVAHAAVCANPDVTVEDIRAASSEGLYDYYTTLDGEMCALAASFSSGVPIRVIRPQPQGDRYDGLYIVVECVETKNNWGVPFFEFRLESQMDSHTRTADMLQIPSDAQFEAFATVTVCITAADFGKPQ